MIAEIVTETFQKIGHAWKVGGTLVAPTEDDVLKVLDHAVSVLYDGDIGDRLEAGGLIIEKTSNGHDIYVYIGNY